MEGWVRNCGHRPVAAPDLPDLRTTPQSAAITSPSPTTPSTPDTAEKKSAFTISEATSSNASSSFGPVAQSWIGAPERRARTTYERPGRNMKIPRLRPTVADEYSPAWCPKSYVGLAGCPFSMRLHSNCAGEKPGGQSVRRPLAVLVGNGIPTSARHSISLCGYLRSRDRDARYLPPIEARNGAPSIQAHLTEGPGLQAAIDPLLRSPWLETGREPHR